MVLQPGNNRVAGGRVGQPQVPDTAVGGRGGFARGGRGGGAEPDRHGDLGTVAFDGLHEVEVAELSGLGFGGGDQVGIDRNNALELGPNGVDLCPMLLNEWFAELEEP